MKNSLKQYLQVFIGLLVLSLLAGCASFSAGDAAAQLAAGEAAFQMTKQNEQDLQAGRQSPHEYRDRRAEIDRALGEYQDPRDAINRNFK